MSIETKWNREKINEAVNSYLEEEKQRFEFFAKNGPPPLIVNQEVYDIFMDHEKAFGEKCTKMLEETMDKINPKMHPIEKAINDMKDNPTTPFTTPHPIQKWLNETMTAILDFNEIHAAIDLLRMECDLFNIDTRNMTLKEVLAAVAEQKKQSNAKF